MGGILRVFLDVVAPVFAIVGLGWALGPKLALEARTLARAAYFFFVPAFTFDVISRARVPAADAARMAAFICAAHLVPAALAFVAARLLGRSREVGAALFMVAVFGNVGNFGLALTQFRFGQAALVPATIYFIATMILSFGACVAVAAWVRGGGAAAIGSVLKTPAIVAVVPAALVAAYDLEVPAVVARAAGLLGSAMIPMMLLALGVQLRETSVTRISTDVLLATGLRLVGGPIIAAALAVPFGLHGVERATGIVQASMPAAVLVAIIAMEYRVAPALVTTTVFVSTLLSLPTLTVVLAWVQ
jgi:predicted permease